MSKYTPWFPASFTPARVGVYQTMPLGLTQWWAKWDGEKWLWGDFTPERASAETRDDPNSEMERRSSKWRGLAKEPK